MFEIDWNIFKAKFNGKEQQEFQDLSYLLFCSEFDQNIGIFEYKNQVGIETEPIEHEEKLIGFQAKFYETKISDNVFDIKDSITKAKSKNPSLDKIFIYTNQEFSESSSKDQKEPKYKIDIEEHTKAIGLEIEWRVSSHFKRQLMLQENSHLAKRFFSLERSTFNLIQDLIQHTESLLNPIQSEIEFEGEVIKVDKSETLNDLKKSIEESQIVILSGKGGVGKTAIIKNFHNQVKDITPFFVFKVTEFNNISNINSLFNVYGGFTLIDFVTEFEQIHEKYIVIDSAEKLSEIGDFNTFQEFLYVLISNNWKVIFTTRLGYLDDLKFQLIQVYRLFFKTLIVEKIKLEELRTLSDKYCFNLPHNENVLTLLQNPFYLSEYLRVYDSTEDSMNLSEFKEILWNKQIMKSEYQKNNIHIRRENSFLEIAYKRSEEGNFYVNTVEPDHEALRSLEAYEIIKYEENTGGYFITHDIYEEWALDKIIERSYKSSSDYENFFNSIGSSLPIRRAFRNWLYEKLFAHQKDIELFIEQSLLNDNIESFWKDEIIVSILLSDNAEVFFLLFETKLLENKQELLMRVIFLLRIACKEVDDKLINQLGLNKTDIAILFTYFTKLKGSGWSSTIDFIYQNIEKLDIQNVSTILLLLDDWNSKNTYGETTKKASQIALQYYENIVSNDVFDYKFNRETKEKLIKVIIQGSAEIKEELKSIFDGIIIRNNPTLHDRDYQLVKVILTSTFDNIEVIKTLPDYVIKLANLFWNKKPKKAGEYNFESAGVEKYFGISENHDFNYFPSSAYQTPIYQLLKFTPNLTIDFILSFTNNAAVAYANSELKYEVREVNVVLYDKYQINQYISNRLWNMYRGTQVSTYLLESIHMALEKWLLEYAKVATAENLEKLCFYLIENSRSASITAVVASVVMANSSKFFNIAMILFKTKEFFFYDTSRKVLDSYVKFNYFIGYGLNHKDDFYYKERIKTCEDGHRTKTLEQIALEYQFFRTDEITDEEVDDRQKVLWETFDEYYEKLEKKYDGMEPEEAWRLYLARMDRRKMRPEVEEEGCLIIDFNPQIEPELKKYSEKSLQKTNKSNKYMSLFLWSRHKFDNNKDEYCKYNQYENNSSLIIKEVKEINQTIKEGAREDSEVFNYFILSYACSVLIRDFSNKLNLEDMEFCKERILEYSKLSLQSNNYRYQEHNLIKPAISVLPYLYSHFSKDEEEASLIKSILTLSLFSNNKEISKFATQAILQNLWRLSFEDAHSIFLCYLNLKPKYDSLFAENRYDYHSKGIFEIAENKVVELFVENYEVDLERVILNKIEYDDISDLRNLDLRVLIHAFELLPLGTKHPDHNKFVLEIFQIFSKRIFEDDSYNEEKNFDYELKTRFLDKFSTFVLSADEDTIETYIQPFVENFKVTNDTYMFFERFIYVQDRLNRYQEFWKVWYAFFEKIKSICTEGKNYYGSKKVIYKYLLAWPYWKKTAAEWHSLKEREKLFYKKVSEEMGHCPSVLYSISKVLNDIGSNFLEDGIFWISNMIDNNANLLSEELEVNTIYYLENIVQKYIFTNRQKIRTTIQTKKAIISILNFLIERGSLTAYMLRENIL